MIRTPLSQLLLLQAPGNRHGMVLEPQRARISLSDMADIVHMGVPGSIESPWESAAGGVGRNEQEAKLAAVGEGVERYCAAIIQLPLKNKNSIPERKRLDADAWCLFTESQKCQEDFPFGAIYAPTCPYTNVYDFQTNSQIWVPHPLVALRDDFRTGIPTSSGLAAGPNAGQALLRAIQELIERDSLMVTWLHGIAARAIPLPEMHIQKVASLRGEVWAFELTPAYSPFPVIAVAGGIPKSGKWRYSLGVACRETWQSALDKAFLEWNQGVLFAGIYEQYVDTSYIRVPTRIKTFDEHAIFYTLYPELWHTLPMFKNRSTLRRVSFPGKAQTTNQALTAIKSAFAKHAINLFYRDMTTMDAEQLGVRVVRAASPDLAPIFAHQEWPLFGNVADMLETRYPWAVGHSQFPNLMPHPLG